MERERDGEQDLNERLQRDIERRTKTDPTPQSEEHKGPVAACLISTHPLKSRAERTHARTHAHAYIHAHGSTRLAAEAEEAPNPTDVFSMAERKSNPEEVIRLTHARLSDQS